MAKLEELTAGTLVAGVVTSGPVRVVAAEWWGTDVVAVTYRTENGDVAERLLYRADEDSLGLVEPGRAWSFDADGRLFRLAAEARRIQLAHLFDPYLGVTASRVEPLPHQIEAVYGRMLPEQQLRFLLADDPGAGKTIMAGLYIKELVLRGDVERCLIVAPGSLATQWQDELLDKFDLRFDIVTRELLEASGVDVFNERPLLIARLDQLARREDLVDRLEGVDWDLVVLDEAHRMAAHYWGAEVRKTKRYRLGEVLGATTRHLLLMTATPHSGKEEDFQLFLALLDHDRFEGRYRDGVHTVDTTDLMRRVVKENLLRFDGTPLFPERRAATVRYRLSPEELSLYDEVTAYVREEMNRADRLTEAGDSRRGGTVGFALTVLQRRLASSPEAIYQSLRRRRGRLEQRVVDERQAARLRLLGLTPAEQRLSDLLADPEADDLGDLAADEVEALEQEVADASSAASTIEELQTEIRILGQLEELARRLVRAGVDRKWSELAGLLADAPEMFDTDGARRKLIIFTEHRDTLNYLVDRIRGFLGRQDAVIAIHGGTGRSERRALQERFMQDAGCTVLVATDAAGEGVNLQRAHLVVNYDLPWNPNRIEQRFGRVHRIGQREVCHMWNLVAEDTREAQVYLRLLEKIEQQRQAYGGQVFDVLGESLSGAELRGLLIQAIRYGERADVRARVDEVIDARVGERLQQVIAEHALSADVLGLADVERIRRRLEEAQARRLQPHYIRAFFLAAFGHLGGRWREREPSRLELTAVPAVMRERDRQVGVGAPLLPAYERVTFDKDLVHVDGAPPADLLAPGHPLLAAAVRVVLERHGGLLRRGSVLVDESPAASDPRVLVMLEHEIVDARPARGRDHTVVSRRFEFVEIDENGRAQPAGYAPYLDHRPLDGQAEHEAVASVLAEPWLTDDLTAYAQRAAIDVSVPEHLAVVRLHVEARVRRVRRAVRERLTKEIHHWDVRADELQLAAEAGRTPRMNPERARQRANDLKRRLRKRMAALDAEQTLHARRPTAVGGSLIVPADLILLRDGEDRLAPAQARDTAVVEARAIRAVLGVEAACGREAEDLNVRQPNHPGYDVVSEASDGTIWFIEVKGRISGADTVTVSRNEVLTGLNSPDQFVLALVEVRPEGGEVVRYVRRPFTGDEAVYFGMTSVNYNWAALWLRGEQPA